MKIKLLILFTALFLSIPVILGPFVLYGLYNDNREALKAVDNAYKYSTKITRETITVILKDSDGGIGVFILPSGEDSISYQFKPTKDITEIKVIRPVRWR